MADSKISALTHSTPLVGTDEFAINHGGTTEKVTASDIDAYTSPLANGAVAALTGFATDTYLTGSGLTVVASRLQAGTWYRILMEAEKTAAGTATAQFVVRMGTAGTTADAAIATLALNSAQTASIDRARMEILVNFNSVGSGTAAVVAAVVMMIHQNTTTGFVSAGGAFMQPTKVTSSGFDSTAVTKIGVSLNAGASASWTLANLQAELANLAP